MVAVVGQLGLTVRNRSVEGVLNRVTGGVGAHRTSRDKGSSEGCPGLDRPSTDQLLMCEDTSGAFYTSISHLALNKCKRILITISPVPSPLRSVHLDETIMQGKKIKDKSIHACIAPSLTL